MFQIRKLLPVMSLAALLVLKIPTSVDAQNLVQDNSSEKLGTTSLLTDATLDNVVQYALKNHPQIQQSQIDQRIVENTIKSKLADWYPQLNFNYNLQHNFLVQTSIIGGNPVKLGVDNTSAAQFTVSQNIFNRDALLANRSQNDVRLQATQTTTNLKIALVANVSKAFYAVLAT
ncbi:MAG: TolC family protein, partial [Flectobacillus sp.]|nr:TolC family protein [Flectobacillus sp.]